MSKEVVALLLLLYIFIFSAGCFAIFYIWRIFNQERIKLRNLKLEIADAKIELSEQQEQAASAIQKNKILQEKTDQLNKETLELLERKSSLQNSLSEKQQDEFALQQEVEKNKAKMQAAANQWFDNHIEPQYQEAEEKLRRTQDEISQLDSALVIITRQLKELSDLERKEKNQKELKETAMLQLSKNEISEICQLQNLSEEFKKPIAVNKLVWSEYIQKPTNVLIENVLGSDNVTGIYKLVDDITGEVYIGQSVAIGTRWKSHIKCGVHADPNNAGTNTLYRKMWEDGVWNFRFELLEQCPKEKLDERETFWINLYDSKNNGLNTIAGKGGK